MAARLKFLSVFLVLLGLSGCMTYYEQSQNIELSYQQNAFDRAFSELRKSSINKKPRNKLLFYLNAGLIKYNQSAFDESNSYFEQAYVFLEDAEKRNTRDAFAYIMNPMQTDYAGENHEVLLLHYYKALNYLKTNRLEEALVEVRRMDNKLKRLNTYYRNENKYKDDAFIHLLMGIIYEASGDNNNAFIAYRNAYNVFNTLYGKLFGMTVPRQLKIDLIRSAYKTGFINEAQKYEADFGIKYVPEPQENATFIALWHNGMAPVKTEISVTMIVQPGAAETFAVSDGSGGFNYTFPEPPDPQQAENLNNLKSFRIALPQYKNRLSVYQDASITFEGLGTKNLEMVEDISKIAPQCLQDRLWKELGQAIARIAIKKAVEYGLEQAAKAEEKKKSKEGENSAAALEGIALAAKLFNTFDEKADTRNWQLLPNAISYTRFSIPSGKNQFAINLAGRNGNSSTTDSCNIAGGSTYFRTITSSAILPGLY